MYVTIPNSPTIWSWQDLCRMTVVGGEGGGGGGGREIGMGMGMGEIGSDFYPSNGTRHWLWLNLCAMGKCESKIGLKVLQYLASSRLHNAFWLVGKHSGRTGVYEHLWACCVRYIYIQSWVHTFKILFIACLLYKYFYPCSKVAHKSILKSANFHW